MVRKITPPQQAFWWTRLTLAEQDEWLSLEESYRELAKEARAYRKLRENIYHLGAQRYRREVARQIAEVAVEVSPILPAWAIHDWTG